MLTHVTASRRDAGPDAERRVAWLEWFGAFALTWAVGTVLAGRNSADPLDLVVGLPLGYAVAWQARRTGEAPLIAAGLLLAAALATGAFSG